jgi:hypothetical protein
MRRSFLIRELLFPLTDTVVLIAIATFVLLMALARQAGWFGLWLGVVLVPGLYRYLLMLLEARALGKATPVAGGEIFNVIDNFWSLTPLVLLAMSIWGGVLLHFKVSPLAAQAFVAVLFVILPASLAILALTRSPLESLNPRAIVAVIRAAGSDYALVPASMLLGACLVAFLKFGGVPALVVAFAGTWSMFLVFTLTGALLHENGVHLNVTIPDPLEPDEDLVTERHVRSRRQVLTHAHNFSTRGNRAGCIAHIRRALQEEADADEAWRWYIGEMFGWEAKDAALMLAQAYLTRLLGEQRDVEAVKLISRCQLEDVRFRPLPEDRDAARDVARRLNRDDLMRALDA